MYGVYNASHLRLPPPNASVHLVIIAVLFCPIGEMFLRLQEERIGKFRITKQCFNTLDRISVVDIICLIGHLDFLPHEIRPARKVVIYDFIQLL